MRRLIATSLICLAVFASVPAQAGPFDKGRIRVALHGGTIRTFDNTYFAIGGGLGYYIFDGLEVGLDGEHWFGGDPSISKLSPQVRYMLHFLAPLVPYVGVFYKHWFIGGDYEDLDSVGGRVGAFWVSGRGLFIGGGVVHEIYLNDDTEDASETYPEIVFSITF